MREAFLAGLSPLPLPVGPLIQGLYSAKAGGVSVFVGVTRSRRSETDPRVTVSLEYQAYEPMAIHELERLLEEARTRWPITAAVALHRTGTVPAGEPSVVVGAAAPHRAEAFEASRWLIDTLKQRVPIWKCERFSDGSHEWAEGSWDLSPHSDIDPS